MVAWNQSTFHKHMHVYSSDNQLLGHIAETYEDSFLVHKGLVFGTNRYIPYEAVAAAGDERVQLSMSAAEAGEMLWEKRPDYEHHLYDPTQLFYDRGHGVHDPFDNSRPDAPGQETTRQDQH